MSYCELFRIATYSAWHRSRRFYSVTNGFRGFVREIIFPINGPWPARRYANETAHTLRRYDENFGGFARAVHHTRSVDVVGKRSQAVISRSDEQECYSTSPRHKFTFGELTVQWVGIVSRELSLLVGNRQTNVLRPFYRSVFTKFCLVVGGFAISWQSVKVCRFWGKGQKSAFLIYKVRRS